MFSVSLVWLLQLGAALFFVLQDAANSEREPSQLAARLGRIIRSRLVIILVCGLLGFLLAGLVNANTYNIAGIAAATTSFYVQLAILVLVVLGMLFTRLAKAARSGPSMVFGSARFADLDDAVSAGLIGWRGIRLGYLYDRAARVARPLHYKGERHLLTIAPTRAGKGVSSIIPNLLTYEGSTIVIDPKGENARVTHDQRKRLTQTYVLDPWGITGQEVACFNPLDMLTADSPTLIDDAMLIADALVIPDQGGQSQFWSDQARALIVGFLIYIATDPAEADCRHLGRLRDILSAPHAEFCDVGEAMERSDNPAVRAAAARILSQNDEVRASILSTAQQNTHFLDSPSLRKNLERSSFRFADLKGFRPKSVYIVLPVDRLGTYNRWLRLLIALGIADLTRVELKNDQPVLFLLDEFAQLGHLQMVEDAYGLMAGMGLQLHAIVQDLSQLDRLYPRSWQTFLANAGMIQVFGTRDLHTAEYFSKMLGQTTATVTSWSESTGTSSGSSSASGQMGTTSHGSNSSSTVSQSSTARPLLFPDELMRMDKAAQLLFIENTPPILAEKIVWYLDPTYQTRGVSPPAKAQAKLPTPTPAALPAAAATPSRPVAAPITLPKIAASATSRFMHIHYAALAWFEQIRCNLVCRFSNNKTVIQTAVAHLDTAKRRLAHRPAM